MSLFNHRSKSHRSSTHIHNIPSEILSQIFISTYPSSIFEPDSEVSSAESILFPRRLSHVCRRWREEALSFGELWSYLFLTEEDIQRDHKMTLEIFRTFLDRSNVSPLNFRFRYCPGFGFFINHPLPCINEGELYTLETIISALLNHQHRWQTVDFFWAYFKASPHFPKIEIFNTPLLKNLSLKVRLDLHDSNPFPAFINLTHSPRLESLDLWGRYELSIGRPKYRLLQCWLSPISLPCHESAKECSSVLKFAPNLRFMDYNTGGGYLDGTYDEPPESHPLKELYLRFGSTHEQILDSVHLPELEKLTCDPAITTSGGRTLLTMIQRSRPPLTSLYIEYIPRDTLFEILCLLPTLVEFTTTVYREADVIFRALEVESAVHDGLDGDQTVLCPRLRALHLYLYLGWGRSDETEERFTSALFTMLESRMINLGTFNKMFFSEHGNCSEDNVRVEVSLQSPDHNIMKQIVNDGGKLSIETSR